jgi:hypothetical protein
MKFLIPLLIATIIFPAPLFANPPETQPQPKVTGIQKDDPAPYSGVLLNSLAAARIFSEKSFSSEECKIKIDYNVGKETARMNLLLESTRVSLDSVEQKYTSIINIKNTEIERLSKIASERPNEYSMWWLAGGVLTGIGLTIALLFAVKEI